jgi:hypothetical protein
MNEGITRVMVWGFGSQSTSRTNLQYQLHSWAYCFDVARIRAFVT